MTENEKILVDRKTLYAVLDAVLALSNKVAESPLLHAAISADADMRKLRLAMVELHKQLNPA